MDWLQADLNLLTVEAAHVRCHLSWLLEDLSVRQESSTAQAITALLGQVQDCLAHLAELDELLRVVHSLLV